MSDERDRLLAATVVHATAHGISELSLRQLASALGTSHRMLVYYFGSKDELLVEVTKAVEARERASLEQLAADDGGDAEAQMRSMWRRLTDPALWPQERLFFELYGQALQGRPHATSLLDGVVDDWIGPIGSLALDVRAEAARHRLAHQARLHALPEEDGARARGASRVDGGDQLRLATPSSTVVVTVMRTPPPTSRSRSPAR